jgi:hypothetical protein
MAEFEDQRAMKGFLDSTLKSKYIDLILLCMVTLAFLMLIIVSSTSA